MIKQSRKSLLYVPGSNAKMCRKAQEMNSDSVIFDLEDAVTIDNKESARANVCSILSGERVVNKEYIVRINDLLTAYGIDDVLEILPCKPDAIIVPKANPKNITMADAFIDIYAEGKVGIIPLIETIKGVVEVKEIMSASDKILGLQFGAEDLTKELGIKRTAEGRELDFARSQMTFTARAHGADAIDTPFVDYNNTKAAQEDLAYIKSIGMTGKTAIHPSQIAMINKTFSYTKEEIDEAVEIIEVYNEGVKNGHGAISLRGKMIDAPIVKRAQDVLSKAGLSV